MNTYAKVRMIQQVVTIFVESFVVVEDLEIKFVQADYWDIRVTMRKGRGTGRY